MTVVTVLGIDLGKNSCSVAGVDETGRVVLRRPDSKGRLDGTARQAAELGCCDGSMLRSPLYGTFCTGAMESTDTMIFGFKDGVCSASGYKQAGPGADKWNADTVTRWVKQGYDIKTVNKAGPKAKAHFDQMWDMANKAAQAARAAREPSKAEAAKTTIA